MTVGGRPELYSASDHDLGPGQYDTHDVGALTWSKADVSHPAQKQLSNQKSSILCSFGKPKSSIGGSGAPLARSPAPGHYTAPDYWDPNWQQYPPKGKSFVRNPPPASESRFGGLARGLVRGTKDMDFLGRS